MMLFYQIGKLTIVKIFTNQCGSLNAITFKNPKGTFVWYRVKEART